MYLTKRIADIQMTFPLNELFIKPNEIYNFSDNDILLLKLRYNVNVKDLNNTNPFNDPYAVGHMLGVLKELLITAPNISIMYGAIYTFLRSIEEHYPFSDCIDVLFAITYSNYITITI